MQDEEEGGIVARLLQETVSGPAPAPEPDLAARTLRHVRNWILMGDLLRLATLEALWARLPAGGRSANPARRRQDP